MSLIARLVRRASEVFGLDPRQDVGEPDEHLAATALLVHVARADGVLDAAEAERLARLIQTRYAASRAAADALIEQAAAFDAEARDLAELVEMIGHEASADERTRLLTMAWSVAGADGTVHEFEEALVWRLGRLMGLDDVVIAGARASGREATAAAIP